MKKTYFFMLVIPMAFFYSCSKDSESELSAFDYTAAAEGEFIATIDGSEFKSLTQDAMIYEGDLYITATDPSTGEMISLKVASPAEATFDLGSDRKSLFTSASYTTMEKSSYFSLHSDAGGTITISELDMDNKTISGTFNFKGIKLTTEYDEVIQITNGAFNKVSFYIPEEMTNKSTAKIDGNPLTFDSIYGYEAFSDIKLSLHASSTNDLIMFDIPIDITAGTYELTSETWAAIYRAGGEDYYSSSGTLNITNHDTEMGLIEGSFEFIARTPYYESSVVIFNITEGDFSIYYAH